MQLFAESLTEYKRLQTLEVKVGDLLIGSSHPIRIQTMTTTDTMNTEATVAETIRCIEAGAELVRITAPSKRDAENLQNIKDELHRKGYTTPLVADIHFTPNAAEIAARIVEKVRINPGNYVDKKKFETITYSNKDYEEEIERISKRFTPLVKICKEYGTAMRIGTNHGSLSDRIMSRYGDTPIGMVESALEFLRIAERENYFNIVLSMKSSNPIVMVEAYRLLIMKMQEELGHCYPLHLGVTEAGDGEDGRIKSAIGIGTLLEDGIGDTIRVSLTEDAEKELPVCRQLVQRYQHTEPSNVPLVDKPEKLYPNIITRTERETFPVQNIGGKHVPVVIADLGHKSTLAEKDLLSAGYSYDSVKGTWKIGELAADYIFSGSTEINFQLPAMAKLIQFPEVWEKQKSTQKTFPIFSETQYLDRDMAKSSFMNFVMLDCFSKNYPAFDQEKLLEQVGNDTTAVICLSSTNQNAVQSIRRMFLELKTREIRNPVILICDSDKGGPEESLIHFAVEIGSLLIDGMGNGICLGYQNRDKEDNTDEGQLNSIAFGILQASRTRISKTEYISCPSCGRTLFDLQETTARIRAVTNHLKGVKIAVMGCIVNGPGEMADADFGYVGSGPGKITLYKGKDVIKRNVPAEVAVEEMIALLRENKVWIEPPLGVGAISNKQ